MIGKEWVCGNDLPWCVEFKNLMKNSLFVPFSARRSKVFWRGQIRSNANERGGLIRCKIVILPKLGRKIEANLFDVAANGVVVDKGGSRILGVSTHTSKQILAKKRCTYKYLEHVEGITYSLAQLPQELCGSFVHTVLLLVPKRFVARCSSRLI